MKLVFILIHYEFFMKQLQKLRRVW